MGGEKEKEKEKKGRGKREAREVFSL